MVLKSLSRLHRAGEIADLDRGAQRVLQRDPLQLERQSAERALDVAEGVARLRPFALAGKGQRAPQRRVVLVADRRIGEVLLRRFDAAEHDVGDRAQHERRRILGGGPLVGDGGVEHGLGLGVHLARKIEARQIEPRARFAPVNGASAAARTRSNWRRAVFGVAVGAPALGVEGHARGRPFAACGAAASDSVKPPGRARITLSADRLGLEIVGERLHGDALGARQRAEIDEVLALDQAARRSKPGDDQEPVADVGVVQPMRLAAARRTGW